MEKYRVKLKSSYTAEIGGDIVSGRAGDVIDVPRQYMISLMQYGIADPVDTSREIARRLIEAASSFSDKEVAAICGLDAPEVKDIRRAMGV